MFLQRFIYDFANFLSGSKCLQYQPFCHIYGFTEYLNAEKVVTDVSNGCVIQDQKNSNSQRNSTLHYFLFQTQLLHQDPDKGIIMSTQSLVLQKVTREMVGDYVCRAVNTEGSRESNPVALKIMCEYKLQNFYTFLYRFCYNLLSLHIYVLNIISQIFMSFIKKLCNIVQMTDVPRHTYTQFDLWLRKKTFETGTLKKVTGIHKTFVQLQEYGNKIFSEFRILFSIIHRYN